MHVCVCVCVCMYDQEDVVVHPDHHTRSVDPCSIDLQSLFVNIKSIFVALIHHVM